MSTLRYGAATERVFYRVPLWCTLASSTPSSTNISPGSSAVECSCAAIQQYLILGTDTSLKAGSGLSAQIHAVSNVHDVFER